MGEPLGFSVGYRIRFDSKRRPTLPASLLEEAGIDPTHELVAHADGRGRLVIEDPAELLASFQAAVAAGVRQAGVTGSLVDDLVADRAADAAADE
jgi:hypothetical protein